MGHIFLSRFLQHDIWFQRGNWRASILGLGNRLLHGHRLWCTVGGSDLYIRTCVAPFHHSILISISSFPAGRQKQRSREARDAHARTLCRVFLHPHRTLVCLGMSCSRSLDKPLRTAGLAGLHKQRFTG